MSPVRLLVLDCDRTMWDHADVSETTPPYRLISPGRAADSRGETISLLPGLRQLLSEARRRDAAVSVASWNRPEPVFALFDLFRLRRAFVHPVVEFHPHKDRMLRAILAALTAEGSTPRLARDPESLSAATVFVDDNPTHAVSTLSAFPRLRVIQMGVDVAAPREVWTAIDTGRWIPSVEEARRRLAAFTHR